MTKVTTRKDDVTKKWIAEASVGNNRIIATASGPSEQIGEIDAIRRLAIILAERIDAITVQCERREEVGLPENR